MRLTASLLVIPLVYLAGCDSCAQSSTPAPAASSDGAAAPPTSSTAAAPSASVAPSGKMAHCPDAVTGAKTDIQDAPGGVVLSVTANDPAAVADIQARTKALIDAQKNQSADVRHTGTGEGGGLLGRCPVVLKDTTVTTADLPGGSRLTITAKNPAEVDWLRRETRDRQEDLAAAGAPAGAGKMSHCPSAVQGSTTTLKNTTDGVSVIITAKADPDVKSIRERSKHLAEVANTPDDGGATTHTGEGGGGGGLGRCPVVVKDTSLKVKDVPGGSQVDVKAKAAADVPKLQAEAKERAAKFQLPSDAPSGSGSSAPPSSSAPSAAPPAAPSSSH